MSKSKKSAKKPAAAAAPTAKPEAADPTTKKIVRAIRVTAEVLDAAKGYKRDKKVSFYQLGLSAISEVLRREGYLKAADA